MTYWPLWYREEVLKKASYVFGSGLKIYVTENFIDNAMGSTIQPLRQTDSLTLAKFLTYTVNTKG